MTVCCDFIISQRNRVVNSLRRILGDLHCFQRISQIQHVSFVDSADDIKTPSKSYSIDILYHRFSDLSCVFLNFIKKI